MESRLERDFEACWAIMGSTADFLLLAGALLVGVLATAVYGMLALPHGYFRAAKACAYGAALIFAAMGIIWAAETNAVFWIRTLIAGGMAAIAAIGLSEAIRQINHLSHTQESSKPLTAQSSFFIDCVPASQPVKSPADGRVYSLNLLPHGGGGIFGEQIGAPGEDVHFLGNEANFWLYRCQVTSYGIGPLISVDIPIKIRFMESVPNRQGRTIGKETFSSLTNVKIRKIDPGITNSFTFYIYNQMEAFAEVDFQKTATAQKLGETSRIDVSIATNLDHPLSLGPRDNRPVVESPKISENEPKKQPAAEPKKQPVQIVESTTPAEKAASDYITRSTTVYNETIRKHLETICAKVADHFGSRLWAPKNQVTKMIDVNSGDTEPLSFVKAKYPDSVWMAARVLVAFETDAARPMIMSYVFIGRIAPGREIVGVYDETKQWRILADGAPDNPKHYDVMVQATAQERTRLLEKLTPEIEKLR